MALNSIIALVTGASRGAGRGIALELGAAGATVYVTGRSVHGAATTDNVPGTIDETARDVTDRGLAVPLMLPQRRGLIVGTTANLDALPYMRNVFYDLAKNAVVRLSKAMAQELGDHGIAALAVAPGFMRTERVVQAFRRAGAAEALDGPGGPKETPAYLGRAIVALASDPRVIDKSGQLVEVGTLAVEYGFTDVDGTQPPPFRVNPST